MKSKTITLILASIVLLLFISVFSTQYAFFNKSFFNQLNELSINAEGGNWQEVDNLYNKISKKWNIGKYIISINNGETEYTELSSNYIELKVAIDTHDTNEIVRKINLIYESHRNFNRIIPLP